MLTVTLTGHQIQFFLQNLRQDYFAQFFLEQIFYQIYTIPQPPLPLPPRISSGPLHSLVKESIAYYLACRLCVLCMCV